MYTPPGFAPAHIMPESLGDDAYVFAFSGGQLLVCGAPADDLQTPSIPRQHELARRGLCGTTHYLGVYDGVACVALNLDTGKEAPATPLSLDLGWRLTGLRPLFFRMPEALVAIAGRAFQIVEWDRTHRFCGQCGTAAVDRPGERARECPACGHTAYPRVSPAMMVLVTRGRDILLARANRFPIGMFSALAGFVEPGETIEDCIHREVREEVGIEVGPPVYFGSQSWSFPHSLMIAFTAEYVGGTLRPDEHEIAEARFFTPEAMPDLPPSLSIARRLIDSTSARLRSLPA
ncbi:MAG: NAD(+) diphosphatase [Casimicrobiaceae bacterium]